MHFEPILTKMATSLTDADIDSTDDPSSSTDAEFEEYTTEFEEYTTPPAGRNEIQPYRFEPTVSTPAVEGDEDSGAENVSPHDDSGAENVSRLENVDW